MLPSLILLRPADLTSWQGMGWSLARALTRTRIAVLLLAEAFVVDSRVLWMLLLALPYFLGYHWYFYGRISPRPTLSYVCLFALALAWRLNARAPEPVPDAPLLLDPASQPAWTALCSDVHSQLGRPVPARIHLALAPGYQRAPGTLEMPAGCLRIWSVLDLRCHIAHAALRRPPRGWLFASASRAVFRLGAELHQLQTPSLQERPALAYQRLFAVLHYRLAEWQLLADLEADAATAAIFGHAAVSGWVQRTTFAVRAIEACFDEAIEPAARQGYAVPLAEACLQWHQRLEPEWLATLLAEMKLAEREDPSAGLSPLALRLGALQHDGGDVLPHDPRPAASCFEDLPSLEESVLRHTVVGLPAQLQPISLEELSRILPPTAPPSSNTASP